MVVVNMAGIDRRGRFLFRLQLTVQAPKASKDARDSRLRIAFIASADLISLGLCSWDGTVIVWEGRSVGRGTIARS